MIDHVTFAIRNVGDCLALPPSFVALQSISAVVGPASLVVDRETFEIRNDHDCPPMPPFVALQSISVVACRGNLLMIDHEIENDPNYHLLLLSFAALQSISVVAGSL
jgi:hypothetical protein